MISAAEYGILTGVELRIASPSVSSADDDVDDKDDDRRETASARSPGVRRAISTVNVPHLRCE